MKFIEFDSLIRSDPHFIFFSETYWGINSSVPLYILVIFGLCMVRDPTFFAKFSAFGTVTVILILFTAFYKVSF